MKKKLEIQTIIVLLCVLVIAGAWIGIQITKDSLGVWSESSQIDFTTSDLLGLGPRSPLQCAGATIGHVRKVTPSIGPDGKARFSLVAGVKNDFVSWKFSPRGIVKAGVVQSSLAPSSISMELSSAPDAVQARRPEDGRPPLLPLEKEKSKNDLAEVAEQYRRLGDQIDLTIRQFTEPKNGRTQSVMQELSEAIPSAATSLRDVGVITANLQKEVSENGKIDQTITSLNDSLARLQVLTDEVTKTVASLNGKMDLSMKKVNGLLDETTGTMTALHGKLEGFGGTFVGRMLIAKPEPVPVPAATPKKLR